MWRLAVTSLAQQQVKINDILIRISHHSGAVGSAQGAVAGEGPSGPTVVMTMMGLASDSCLILTTLFRTCNSQVIKHPYGRAETPDT